MSVFMRFDNFSTCERLFLEGKNYFHVCTKPVETDVFFQSEEEMNLALNAIAIAVFLSGCRLLAFAVMSNHFHFIIEGSLDVCKLFFKEFQAHMTKCMERLEVKKMLKACEAQYITIDSLKQLRDEIAYVVRNPFAARNNVNMFAYRWCSGYLYFNDVMPLFKTGTRACEMTYDWRRSFTKTRFGEVDSRIMVVDGIALPSCFVDYKRAESFFENAREYQHCLLKNVESQVSIAKRLGDTLVLDDHEMWETVYRICRNMYKVSSPKELSSENKVSLARTLKYNYNASNAQIARCTGMIRSAIDQIFPLSARSK
ncbi:MAG: hypothetical protein J5675_02770 [Bacteroidales bacterium]|nr:hypothetical protein [Bacteroidales bacterium]